MITYLNLSKRSSKYEVELDGQSILIQYYYSKFSDRWIMDIENKTNGEKAFGIIMNVGDDLIRNIGRIGLESLVLISLPKPGLESTFENFMEGVLLAYMSIEEFSAYSIFLLVPESLNINSSSYIEIEERRPYRSSWIRNA